MSILRLPLALSTHQKRMLNCSYLFSNFISLHVFVIGLVLLLILIDYIFWKSVGHSACGKAGLVLLNLGGALNIYQRLATGCVTDALNFINLVHFNLADLLIVVGIIILLFSSTIKPVK